MVQSILTILNSQERKVMKIINLAALFCFTIASPAPATSLFEPATQEYIKWLQNINYYSNLDGAGSKGSWGSSFGLGGILTYTPEDNPFLQENLIVDKPGRKVLPRVFISKGFTIPLNIGVSYSAWNNGSITQWGTNASLILIEGKGIPSLSIGLDSTKVFGLDRTSAENSSGSITTSYLFSPRFEIYLKAKKSRMTAKVELGEDTRLLLNEAPESESWKISRYQNTQSLGLIYRFILPFYSLSIERININAEEVAMMKLTLGM